VQRPGESLSAADLEALESQAVVEQAEDIDIEAWLTEQAQAGKEFGEVVIDGKRIKVAPITEGEENRLLRSSRRPNPQNPKEQKVDMLVYRRAYVAFSLSKAYSRTIMPDDSRVVDMLPGVLTCLQVEIQKLSKYEIPERQTDPFVSLL
jgi:hypothetical protein